MRKGPIALFLVLGLACFAEEQVYRSNATGMILERIAPSLRDENRWVLTVDTNPGGEVRRLWEDGRERKRWEVVADKSHRQETELSGGTVVARRTWDDCAAHDVSLQRGAPAPRTDPRR